MGAVLAGSRRSGQRQRRFICVTFFRHHRSCSPKKRAPCPGLEERPAWLGPGLKRQLNRWRRENWLEGRLSLTVLRQVD
jgi:hypothetical protein